MLRKPFSFSPHLAADGVVLLISVLGGGSFALVKLALEGTSPANFIFLRLSVATISLLPFAWLKRRSWSTEFCRAGVVIGLLMFGGFITQTLGLVYTSASRGGFITTFYVILVPFLSIVLLRQMPGWLAISASGLAFAGLYLFTTADKVQGLPFNVGDVLILVSAFLWAGHIVAVGHYSPRMDTFWLLFLQLGIASIGSCLWSALAGDMTLNLPAATLGEILVLAVACTVLITLGQVWAQARTSPTRTAIIWSTEPVFAAFFAWWWVGERMGVWGWVGCAFILGGILLVELGPKK